MRNFKQVLAAVVFSGIAATASALPVANSIADFSAVQGAEGWTYGFFDAGAAPGANYTVDRFVAFDTFSTLVPARPRWEASTLQVLEKNNFYLNIDAKGGHPTGIGPDDQDRIIWAMRRYTTDAAGLLDLSYDLRKENFSNTFGGGITGHIFVDGVELLDQLIENADKVGVQDTITRMVNAGSFIDLAIAPTGRDSSRDPSIHNARADGTFFSVVIDTHTASVPEPSGLGLMLTALGVMGLVGFGSRRRPAAI